MDKLKFIKKKHSGRDSSGQVSVRHQGGEQKKFIHVIDFKRDKHMVGRVMAIEYDPNRTVDIALISYSDGEKRYILAPEGLQAGMSINTSNNAEIKTGNAMPLSGIPIGTVVHNVELTPGKGGQLARSAGTSAIIAAREENFVHLRLPSGEVRKIISEGMASIGELGNIEWKNEVLVKQV